MTTQISINSLAFRLNGLLHNDIRKKPSKYFFLSRANIGSFKYQSSSTRSFFGGGRGGSGKDGVLMKDERCKRKKKREVVVRLFNGGGNGGGGGGKDEGATARVVGNLALAIGLTYLSFTGQLGWLLDAIVSIWLLAVLVPIVGVGAFLWWARQDMVQDSCPNCGNDFQIFKSALNDELQQCPFCSQPFSVVDNKFVMESNQSSTFGQAFNDYTRSRGKESSRPVVDIEAEVKDAD